MISPLADRIVIEPVKGEEARTASGIIAGNADAFTGQESLQGKVLATGPEVKAVKVGDKVIYGQFAPTRAREGINVYSILSEDDVMAIVTEK